MQARKDILDLNLTAPEVQHFNTDSGKMEKLDLSKKRPFNSITEVPILATSEEKIKEAMMQYHQDTFLPNLNALIDNCRKFYHNTIHELYYSQLKVDMMDSRLKTLEARFGNKSLLIKGLPAHGHNRTELEHVRTECLALFSEIGSFVGVLGCHEYTYFENGRLRHALGIYH